MDKLKEQFPKSEFIKFPDEVKTPEELLNNLQTKIVPFLKTKASELIADARSLIETVDISSAQREGRKMLSELTQVRDVLNALYDYIPIVEERHKELQKQQEKNKKDNLPEIEIIDDLPIVNKEKSVLELRGLFYEAINNLNRDLNPKINDFKENYNYYNSLIKDQVLSKQEVIDIYAKAYKMIKREKGPIVDDLIHDLKQRNIYFY